MYQRYQPKFSQPPGGQTPPASPRRAGTSYPRGNGPPAPLKGPQSGPGRPAPPRPQQAPRRRGPAQQGPPPPKGRRPNADTAVHPPDRQAPQGAPSGRRPDKSPLLGLLPPSLYNPETGRILGRFSPEDLLLAALILLLLDRDCQEEDPMLPYALLYILLSDFIDLPF